MTLELPLILGAFIAGLFMFLAPCTLPLVPGYLAFISGTSLKNLSNKAKKKKAKRKIILNGIFYVLGFSIVFTTLGSLAGFVGGALDAYRIWLVRIGGVFVLFFGLFMMKVFDIPFLDKDIKLKTPSFFKTGKPSNSLLLGVLFALGWSPCVGPVLASILTLASTSATVLKGSLMLFIFSMGLGVPFLLIAFSIGSASSILDKLSKYLDTVSFIAGLFLVLLGILLITDNMALLVRYGFELFDFLNYDALLKFM